jgi:hypothetical protein
MYCLVKKRAFGWHLIVIGRKRRASCCIHLPTETAANRTSNRSKLTAAFHEIVSGNRTLKRVSYL